MKIGDRVVIARDEQTYPSKGTWPRFRGKVGTVVEINHDRRRPDRTEYAVCWGRVRPSAHRFGGYDWDAYAVAWFKSQEMRPMCPQIDADARTDTPAIEDSGQREMAAHG